MKFHLTALCCFFVLNAVAERVDSLLNLIRQEPDSAVRSGYYLDLLVSYRWNYPDNFEKMYEDLYDYYSKKDDHLKLGVIFREKGWKFQAQQRQDSADFYFARAFGEYEMSGSRIHIAEGYWLKGMAARSASNYDLAVRELLKGLNELKIISEGKITVDRKKYEATLFNIQIELTGVYVDQKDYLQAHKVLAESEANANASGDLFRIGKVQNAIGGLYYYQNKFDESIEHFKLAVKAYESSNEYQEMYETYNNIGLVYKEKKDYRNSLFWLNKSLENSNQRNQHLGIAQSLFNLGELYTDMKDYPMAEEYYLKSLAISRRILNKNQQMLNFQALANIFGKGRQFEKAFGYMSSYAFLKDTILAEERNKAIAEMQTKYDSEKKEQENVILKEQTINQELVNSRQRLILLAVSAVAILIVIFSFYIYRSYQQKKKANVVLAEKNVVIEQKSRIVEEQNKDIKDSIRYAKRLQEAILPNVGKLNDWFPDSFILFRPKDIVSGDFYWFEKFGDQIFFAAADCTGHGVPGAFMSIMGSNLLNQALNEYALTKPNTILNSVNKGLAKALRTHGETGTSVKDGMDIALCSIDLKSLMLEYSGAFNPAWIFRGNTVTELSANKFPVGEYADGEVKMFNAHSHQLQKGDRVFVFTDGIPDQFGGPKGKKFKYKPFLEMLQLAGNMPMKQQLNLLVSTVDEWRGNLEQVDDILVIGIRV